MMSKTSPLRVVGSDDATNAIPNDLQAFWMPFTANRAFKARPRMIARAKDMYYYTPEGRPVMDGTAGLWCSNAGHGREPIVQAIQKTAAELDFSPTFQYGHPKAFELASRLAAMAPNDLDHVFFCNSGSEAGDTALKVALAYWNVRGKGSKTRLIGRERGYHGVGFGGITVGGIVNNRKFFGSLLAGADHLPHTYNREKQAFSKGEPEWGAHLADELAVDLARLDPVVELTNPTPACALELDVEGDPGAVRDVHRHPRRPARARDDGRGEGAPPRRVVEVTVGVLVVVVVGVVVTVVVAGAVVATVSPSPPELRMIA